MFKFNNIIQYFCTRVFFIYFIVLLLVFAFADRQESFINAKSQAMNRLAARINYIKDVKNLNNPALKYRLLDCQYYHKKVADYFSFQKAESYMMIGYCSYYLGQVNKAVKAYETSINVNGNLFWAFYNLGVLAYQKGDFDKASRYFLDAFNRDIDINAFLLNHSKVLIDVRESDLGVSYDFTDALKEAKPKVFVLLMDSLLRARKYKELLNLAAKGLTANYAPVGELNYYAGVAAFHLGNLDRAAEFLYQVIKDDPNKTDAFYYLAMVLKAVGQHNSAGIIAKKAELLNAVYPSTLNKPLSLSIRIF